MSKLRAGVVGVGHLGQHHARNYAGLEGVTLVGVADRSGARAGEIAAKHGVAAFDDPLALIGKVDLVSVATPTESHHAIAKAYLEAGVAVLVEKPMCKTVAEAKDLAETASARGVTLQVGHIERFNPALVAIRSRIENPRFIVTERISPFSFRSADVGVVLDLMIHDLDIVLALNDSPVVDVEAFGVPVIAQSEDLAYARLRFQNGSGAVLNTSRVAVKRSRKIRIFQPSGYVTLDYNERKAAIFKKRPGFEFGTADVSQVDTKLPPAELQALVFSQYLEIEEVSMEAEEPLKLELKSFVEAVREKRRPVVSGEDGLRAMEVAERILACMQAELAAERARQAQR